MVGFFDDSRSTMCVHGNFSPQNVNEIEKKNDKTKMNASKNKNGNFFLHSHAFSLPLFLPFIPSTVACFVFYYPAASAHTHHIAHTTNIISCVLHDRGRTSAKKSEGESSSSLFFFYTIRNCFLSNFS